MATTTAESDIQAARPMPAVAYVRKLKFRPKPCLRCAECKKPDCGTCRTCASASRKRERQEEAATKPKDEADDAAPAAADGTPVAKRKRSDKKRCLAKRCVAVERAVASALPKAPEGEPPVPSTVEDIAAELKVLRDRLDVAAAAMAAGDQSDDAAYRRDQARRTLLEDAKAVLEAVRPGRSRRRAFRPCHTHVWKVVSDLEDARARHAAAVLHSAEKTSAKEIALHRALRDALAASICTMMRHFAPVLAPLDPTQRAKFHSLLPPSPAAAEEIAPSSDSDDGADTDDGESDS